MAASDVPWLPFSFLSYSFLLPRPTPSCRFSLTCLLELVPRPRAWDVRTVDLSAAVGGTAICLLLIMSYRSLAVARSLLLFGSSSVMFRLPRAVRFASSACLIAQGHRLPVFFN